MSAFSRAPARGAHIIVRLDRARWWQRTRNYIFGTGIALVLLAGVIALQTNRSDAGEAVREFVLSVQDGNIDHALSFVAADSVPFGESARFLTEAAVADDWGLSSVTTEASSGRYAQEVRLTITGPHGTATGDIQVERDHDDQWMLVNPFSFVTFDPPPFEDQPGQPSPLEYGEVNGMIAEVSEGTVYALFPGMYRFHQPTSTVDFSAHDPVVALPGDGTDEDPHPVVTPLVQMTPDGLHQVQATVDATIDDCTRFQTALPRGCPFGAGSITTPEGLDLTKPHDLTWQISAYPQITVSDLRIDPDPQARTGLQVGGDEGTVVLSGTGLDAEGTAVDFTIECAIDPTVFSVSVTSDGEVATVAGRPAGYVDTCSGES